MIRFISFGPFKSNIVVGIICHFTVKLYNFCTALIMVEVPSPHPCTAMISDTI